MATYAGVDLGATSVRAVVGDGDGTILGREKRNTPRGPTGIDVTEAVLDTLRAACDRAGVDPSSITACGVGSIGPLDLAAGSVERPANLPDHIDTVPLTGPLSHLVEGEVYLHNDTSAGVIGERFYSERNPDDMVYLTVSTGIGAGVCVDGNVLTGWDGNAGEIGHVRIDPAGEMTCGCGLDGHWEAYCSGSSIPRYARHLHDGEPTSLPVEAPDLDAATVFDHAEDDPFAASVIDRVVEWSATGLSIVVHAYAPLVVYLGGAVSLNNPEQFVDPVHEALDDLVMTNVPEVALTEFGDDVVVRGALASAMTEGTGDRSRLPR